MSPSTDSELGDLVRQFADMDTGADHRVPGQGSSLEQLVRDSLLEQAAVKTDPEEPDAAEPRQPAPDAADVLLEALHQDYLRTLEDPQHPGGSVAWSLQTGDTQGVLADEFERLKADASRGHGLYDLLAPPPEIDELMLGLDTGTSLDDFLASELPDSVLHLLAPAPHRRGDGDGDLLEPFGHDPLPTLTRKEHHDLALDSAIGSLLATPSAAPPPPADPTRHEP